MYPYFTKHSRDLHAAEQSAPGDLLRLFLKQNPEYGTLQFQVTGGQGAFPIAGAQFVITQDLDETHAFSISTLTDSSGKTDPLALPAPSKLISQTPGNGSAGFVTYRAEITAPGYVGTEVLDIPVFDGVATIQPVNLSTDINGMRREEIERIQDEEPNL